MYLWWLNAVCFAKSNHWNGIAVCINVVCDQTSAFNGDWMNPLDFFTSMIFIWISSHFQYKLIWSLYLGFLNFVFLDARWYLNVCNFNYNILCIPYDKLLPFQVKIIDPASSKNSGSIVFFNGLDQKRRRIESTIGVFEFQTYFVFAAC